VLTWRGLVTYYVLFFIHLESRRVSIAGITVHPEACWMRQMACNATLEGMGDLNSCRCVLHDRDAKFSAAFRESSSAAGGVKCLVLYKTLTGRYAFHAENPARVIAAILKEKPRPLDQVVVYPQTTQIN
jgi:hypothetical protein